VPKFYRKSSVVDAERFFPEKLPWPDGVIGLRNQAITSGYGIIASGGIMFVLPGDHHAI
jgi:hypothetical protein